MKTIRRGSRAWFGAAFAAAIAAFWVTLAVSEAALPWMAGVLAPRGLNAAFVLNGIWFTAGMVFVAVMVWLIAARMRDTGRSPWWGPAAVLPLAALALVNDAIFLVSRSLALPGWLSSLLLAVFGGLALWVLAQCLRDGRQAG